MSEDVKEPEAPEPFDPSAFVPKTLTRGKHNAYGLMAVALTKCPTCGCWMLNRKAKRMQGSIFPFFYQIDLGVQMQRVGWRYTSEVTVEGEEVICEQCALDNRGYFTCALCGQQRENSLEQDRFGDPPEFLCQVCYETVPAKVWREKSSQLYDAHRWDFE